MDPILLTVGFKGLGMLLALAGGILIAWYGYRLYRDGAGAGRDQAGFELGSMKLKAHSVGSVVMSTAFLWAWAGVTLSPNLDKKGDAVRIYSMSTPTGDIEAVELATMSPTPQASANDPEKLKKLLEAASKAKGSSVAQLDGRPASIDFSTFKIVPRALLNAGRSDYLITAKVLAGDKSATLAYEPKAEGERLVFVPSSPRL